MAANKVAARMSASAPSYHIDDVQGNHVIVQQIGRILRVGSASTYVDLTQQNVADLLPALTAFSTSGVLT